MASKQKWTVFLLLCVLFWSLGIASEADTESQLHRFHRDIILLNLIRGLYLSPEQTETLIVKIESAQKIWDDFEKEMDSQKSDFENVLKDVRNVLLGEKKSRKI